MVKLTQLCVLFSVVQVESRYEDVNAFCDNLYAENIRSPYLLAFMIDILEDRLETQSCQDTPQTLCRAFEVPVCPVFNFLCLRPT